jgi:myosin heavy subunit
VSIRFIGRKANEFHVCALSARRANLTITPQVFFRAGVLGTMEELRDDRLGKIVGWMQAFMRGYLARKDYKKLQEQR